MEDVFVMCENLWGYIAYVCEIDGSEEIFEDRDSEDCSSVWWVDECDSGFFFNFVVIDFNILFFC